MTDIPKEPSHKNDMYGDINARSESDAGVKPPIPAATVVLLRDGDSGVEVLMLRKNSKITFGGMWVFPGGKIDPEDRHAAADDTHAARTAAARETLEETGLVVSPEDFTWFAHWTPPPGPQKRFATWFFASAVDSDDDVIIDDGEIKEHAWISPAAALARHAAGEIDLVPPTWVTLYQLSRYTPTTQLMDQLTRQQARYYATRVVQDGNGTRVALWHGDAGYEHWSADVDGERHRLVMSTDGFVFENTVVDY
jgi:8-oxo-dGTP pyrophosphatase MutT (NUDIX family)